MQNILYAIMTSSTKKLGSSPNCQSLSKFFQPKRRRTDEKSPIAVDNETKKNDSADLAVSINMESEQQLVGTAENPLNILDDEEGDVEDEQQLFKERNVSSPVSTSAVTPVPPIAAATKNDTEMESGQAVEEDQEPLEKIGSPSDKPKSTSNLFSMFAYRQSSSPDGSSPSKKLKRQSSLNQWANPSTKSASTRASEQSQVIRTTIHSHQDATKKNSKKKKEVRSGEFVRMKDHSIQEQLRITKKWHSLADPEAPLEVRRFQVLIATRLHARCQEPSVRKAMEELRTVFARNSDNESGTGDTSSLDVWAVSKADPEVLAHYVSNLQFYRVKAKHIVQASKQIITHFGGVVPEDEHSLLKIVGVGKTFADLLAFVNTRKAWANQASDLQS